MGIVTMGVPEEIVTDLAKLSDAKVFVETGTYKGGTTRWAAEHFEFVHTIERAENIFNEYSGELAKIDGVTPHFGDSKDVLPTIVKSLSNETAIHWLDGHWSGGPTAGEDDECPVMAELACLADRPDDIILIDDARFFLCAPQPPHNPSQWPTIAEIVEALPVGENRPFIQIVDDVIFIVPNKPHLKRRLTEYCQMRTAVFWEEFSANQTAQRPGLRRTISGLKSRVLG